jgi:uncharacterized protein YbaR (Trm112 family)
MTCKHCGTTFDETKVIRLHDELICCPNCRALQNVVDEEDEEEVTKDTNPVARMLHIIAFITWTAGALFVIASLFINPDAITFFTCCCYLYAIFVSGMFTYAFAEVIQLLTDIRDS